MWNIPIAYLYIIYWKMVKVVWMGLLQIINNSKKSVMKNKENEREKNNTRKKPVKKKSN